MKPLTYQINRDGWPKGPWDDEIDRLQWQTNNLTCLIIRARHGGLTGNVGVPLSHRLFNVNYNDIDCKVHGGLTFSGFISSDFKKLWWLGFDTAHAGDLSPAYEAMVRTYIQIHCLEGKYRTFEYVKAQTESLADQIYELR